MEERNYWKMLEANFEDALKCLVGTSSSEFVDLYELQIRDYVKCLQVHNEINDMISGGSTITIKDEILNPNKQ